MKKWPHYVVETAKSHLFSSGGFGMREILPGIYKAVLTDGHAVEGMPEVNIFIIKGDRGGRSLMVDAGYDNEANRSLMAASLKELGISFDRLDIFITHKHHDHIGLSKFYAEQGAAIYMNPEEERFPYDCVSPDEYSIGSAFEETVLRSMGVSETADSRLWRYIMESDKKMGHMSGSRYFTGAGTYMYKPVKEGQVFVSGGYSFEAMLLRGHTYGQMGLADKTKKIAFTADHIIKGTNPIVGTTYLDEHLLTLYFHFLERVKVSLAGYTIYPSHGEALEGPGEIPDHIAESYRLKLDMLRNMLKKSPYPVTVKEAAFYIYKRGASYDSVRSMTDRLCMTKTYSCLEYLHDRGEISRTWKNGVLYWKFK